MATFQIIDDESAAARLAELINSTQRRRPVVVVTTPAGRVEPWIDVDEIASEAGDLAEVYLMRTGDCSWEFSRGMADGTQVYGGAGRAYPVGHGWVQDWKQSPLHFAFNEADGGRATIELVSDALRMGAAAGLLRAQPTKTLRQVTGTVGSLIAKRALVDVGSQLPATIAAELTVEDVPIERLFTVGQQVTGLLDSETKRVDVTRNLRPATEGLAAYAVGDVVLAKVTMVRRGKAELVLYPRTSTPAVTVNVLRADVTDNELDDLRTLLTVGEVIRTRVVETGPRWAVVLHDVDDDEAIVPAPALLPGGPPWLVEEGDVPDLEEQEIAPLVPPVPTPESSVPEPVVDEPPAPEPPRPSPAIFDRNRRVTPPAPSPDQLVPAAPKDSTKGLLLKIDGLNAAVGQLQREQKSLRTELRVMGFENDQLRYDLAQAERRAKKAEHDLKNAKNRLLKAETRRPKLVESPRPQFADREQGFRYLVLTKWALQTPPGQQEGRPLPDYDLGPGFLDSLDKLDGIKDEKVAEVVFEIVTGVAPQKQSRGVHRLRTGTGPEAPDRTREDGAVCWRAYLQVNTPSARRIHYWILPGGKVEVARVAIHDDFEV